jgi:predicted aconitase with swiveling domain
VVSVIIKGRGISRGIASGELLISVEPISFLSGVNPDTGTIIEQGHPLEGESIAGRVLVFPYGKGSTVGSYVIYALKQNGCAPAAIINSEAEPIIAVGAIIAGIPMIDRLPVEFSRLVNGMSVTVNGDTGELACDENL